MLRVLGAFSSLIFVAMPALAQSHLLTDEEATKLLNAPFNFMQNNPKYMEGLRFPLGKVRMVELGDPNKHQMKWFAKLDDDGAAGEVDSSYLAQIRALEVGGLVTISGPVDGFVLITPTSDGRSFIGADNHNLLLIPEYESATEHVVRIENKHIGISDYAVVMWNGEASFTAAYRNWCLTYWKREPEPYKGVALLKYDDYSSTWQQIAADVSLKSRQFRTNNVESKFRELQQSPPN